MRVDFYVLGVSDPQAVSHFACRLAEKAWRAGHRVWLHTPSGDAARELDVALWTFRDDSFVPHALAGSDDEDCPILIGRGAEPDDAPDVLINLAPQVPDWVRRCSRIAEIVGADEQARAAGRDRFRTYRELGCEPESHRIEGGR
jgi:DNA polymerase-3 subunit chi